MKGALKSLFKVPSSGKMSGASSGSGTAAWEDFSTFSNRFHGHDERIDVDSLALATDFWVNIATDICG